MTTALAYIEGSSGAIAADRLTVGHYAEQIHTKIAVLGTTGAMVAVAGSVRACNLAFELSPMHDKARTLWEAVAADLRDRGWGATLPDGAWSLGLELLAVKPAPRGEAARIEVVDTTGGVHVPVAPYAAIGSGSMIAVGALHVLDTFVREGHDLSPKGVARRAIEAAAVHCNWSGGPPEVIEVIREDA